MDVVAMDLAEAEVLARAGHAGRVATALLSELERVRAELAEYGEKFVQAQRRIAELEAQQGESTGTEWGVRRGSHIMGGSEESARWSIEIHGGELVTRTAPGPWRAAQ